MVTLSFQPARHGTASPVGSPVDGDVEIGFGILDDHVPRAGKIDPDPAAFVLTPAGAVLVREADRDSVQLVASPAECEL